MSHMQFSGCEFTAGVCDLKKLAKKRRATLRRAPS